jgi:ribosomal protein S27AE
VGIERLPPPPPDEWLPFGLPPTGLALAALSRPAALIQWEGNPRATYPMLTMSEALAKGDDRFPPDLIIDLADDFINPDPDPYGIGGDEVRRMNPTCRCGFDLGYEAGMEHWLAGEKIRRVCPQCGLAFRPEDHVADFIEGSDGSKTPQPGGLCSRFAIIIDCNKDWPLYTVSNGELVDSLAQVSPLFMETCRSALGTELEDFSYYS